MSVSTAFFSSVIPRSAWVARLRPSNPNGPGHDADRQGAQVPRDLRDDRRAAGPGPAALAGGDEDHVGALDDLLDLVGVLLRGTPPDIGVGPRTEPPRGLPADVELHLGIRHQQGLCVRVHGGELHAPEACLDHPVHGVHAAPADPDDLDHGEVVLRSVHHPNPSRAPARVLGMLVLVSRYSVLHLLRYCRAQLQTLRLHLNVITISSSCGGSDPTWKSQVRQEVRRAGAGPRLRFLATVADQANSGI